MPPPHDAASPPPIAREFAALIEASGRTQANAAAYIARATGRPARHYHVSRWASGQTKIPVEVMDAVRKMADAESPSGPAQRDAEPPNRAPAPNETPALLVPLFANAGAPNSAKFAPGREIAFIPAHPAQLNATAAFAFVVYGDTLAPMLRQGDTAFAIRDLNPPKGRACVVELNDGDHIVGFFDRADDHSAFLQIAGRQSLRTIPIREIAHISAVVGVTYA